MQWLTRIKLHAKLALLLGLGVLGVVALTGIAATMLHQRMIDDRIDKLRAAIHITLGLAQSLDNQVADHRMTHAQALEQMRDAARVIRFDGGEGYIYAQTLDNMFVVHGANPKLENTASTVKAADGRSLTSLIAAALGNADEGFVTYVFPKPGQTVSQPKVAYVARFAPWNLVFGVGAYTDDLDAAFYTALRRLAAIGGTILAATLLTA